MKKHLFYGLLAILLCSCLITNKNNLSANGESSVIIVSPYNGVDWHNFGQYKAALHVHTTNSDGLNTFSQVIEDHYEKDFDILAVTDHNRVTVDWVSARNGLSQERFAAITAGEGRDGRGMLQVPYANEQSNSDHINSFFINYNNPGGISLRNNIERVEDNGGISFINHPGRYTNGVAGGITGENASNNERNIRKYVNLFMEFPSCVGMEIINKKDGDSASDRILWDNILSWTIPRGRYVWGFSNDDTHSNSNTGYSFNVFIMPENTLENFRNAMLSGSFYAVARVSKRELGSSFTAAGAVPAILNINVDNDAANITIAADNYSRIEWISAGKKVAEGETICLNTHKNNINSYIRANIIGAGGIAFTQPFGIIGNKQSYLQRH